MTTDELLSELQATPEELQGWLAAGMPSECDGAEVDPEAVRAWLIGQDLATAHEPRIVGTQQEVADAFGLHVQTVKVWAGRGMPTHPEGYDLDAIAEWRASDGRRGSVVATGDEQRQRLLAQIRTLTADAENRELRNAKARGDVLDRADVVQTVGALCLRVKERLEALPEEIAMDLPTEVRATIQARWENQIAHVLTELAAIHVA